MSEIRSAQGNIKQNRNKVFEQLKGVQDGIQKKVRGSPFVIRISRVLRYYHAKVKDLQAAKGKVPFKTVADVDERIRSVWHTSDFPAPS